MSPLQKLFLLTISWCALMMSEGISAQPKASWTIPDGVQTTLINGYPMAFSSKGAGPTIVFVHGVLGDYRYWQQAADSWKNDYRIISISMRHFYPEKWDGKGSDFSVSQHAKDIATFIESIGGPVYLVGWSYGGRPSYEVARMRPDLIKKLVLVEGGPDMRSRPPGVAPDFDVIDRAIKTAKYFDAGDVDGGLQFAVDDISGAGRWAGLPESNRESLRDNAWTVVGIGRGDPYTGTCAEFGSLKMPVLLIKGELTTPRLRDIVLEESKCLPQASMVTIPNAGHSSAAMNPPAFKQAVYSFLKQ